jgi:hypothetical protein
VGASAIVNMVCLNSNEYVNDVLKVKEDRLKSISFFYSKVNRHVTRMSNGVMFNSSDLKYRTIVRTQTRQSI